MPNYDSAYTGTQIDQAVGEAQNEQAATTAALRNVSPATAQRVRVLGGAEYVWVDGDQSIEVVRSTGTTSSASANKLIDTGTPATFSTDGVIAGDTVNNTTDGTSATVSSVDSETQLTLSADIFTSGEAYSVGYNNKGLYLTSGVSGYGVGEANEGRWKAQGTEGTLTFQMFGADSTGQVDATTAINTALTVAFYQNRAAEAAGGGQSFAFVDQGQFLVSDTIVIPHRVSVTGTGGGRGDAAFIADSGATWTNKALVSLGGLRTQAPWSDADQNAFGAMLRNWKVDCNNVVPIGVESFYANQLSGCEGVWIRKPIRWGLFFIHTGARSDLAAVITDFSPPAWYTTADNTRQGTAQNYVLNNITVDLADDGSLVDGAAGAVIFGGSADIRGMDNFDCNSAGDTTGYAGVTNTAAIRLDAARGLYSRIHTENTKYGVAAGEVAACPAFAVLGMSTNADTDVAVYIAAADGQAGETEDYTLVNIEYIDGVAKTLDDDIKTIDVTSGIGFFSAGPNDRRIGAIKLKNKLEAPDGEVGLNVLVDDPDVIYQGINRGGAATVYADPILRYVVDADGVNGDLTVVQITPNSTTLRPEDNAQTGVIKIKPIQSEAAPWAESTFEVDSDGSVSIGPGDATPPTKVLGNQGAAVADASGGATVDAEARTAINALLARLRTHGLIAT